MPSELFEFSLNTIPNKIYNISSQIEQFLSQTQIKDGIVTVFLPGSTGGITTLEFEPGLVETDVPKLLQQLIPDGSEYAHHKTWGDHNGHSHLRSFFIKPSLTIPMHNSRLLCGTWQQIVFCEFDEKPRIRKIFCQFVG